MTRSRRRADAPDAVDAPVGLDRDTRVKLGDLPLLAPKDVLAGREEPVELALDALADRKSVV